MSDPLKTFQVDQLRVSVFASQADLAARVTETAHQCLVDSLAARGEAAAILATGNSQLRFLEALAAKGGIDWSRITLFHMDEYLGIPADHPASFRKYMRERVESRLHPRVFHYIEGDALQPLKECERYTGLLKAQPVDLCCMGIGENGHIAFNDPPVAEFDDPSSVKIVKLDDACKWQQVNEGHFPNLAAVPAYALTLTIPALVGARRILCVAPESRKARAVKDALQGPIHADCPASILRRQPHASLYLDTDSAALLDG
jgi:glucosamine-6-phosphate deaminase